VLQEIVLMGNVMSQKRRQKQVIREIWYNQKKI